MYPQLPLTNASIRDLCEGIDFLMTELEYGDKTYLHDTFTTYTYNGESIIFVDTSVPRTIRLAQTPNIKRSVIIKDITGNAGDNPILITIAENTAGTVTLQGQTGREYQMFVPWGTLELTGNGNQWLITVPRSTCISNRGFRLPQNLNLALPPAIGAVRQAFPAMVLFPATLQGSDIVPSNYNGLSASVAYEEQLTTADDTAALTSLFAQPNPPTVPPTSVSALSITVNTTWNIPGDFPSLAAAMLYLSNKDIFPDVQVTLATEVDNISSLVNFTHPQASQIVIEGQAPLVIIPESTTVVQTVPGSIYVDLTMNLAYLNQCPVGSYILIDQIKGWPTLNPPAGQPGDLRRWAGAWPVIAHVVNADGPYNARIQISDWGKNFSTIDMVPDQCRFRVLPSMVNVVGNGQLYFGDDGFTFNNIAFIGAGNAQTGLLAKGVLNLNTVSISGFVNGLYGSYKSVLNCQDVFSCGNSSIGIYLERGAILNGDISASGAALYTSGNGSVGLEANVSSQAIVNPLFSSGNKNWGVGAIALSLTTISNSWILANGYGIVCEQEGLANGATNNISESTNNDLYVSDAGQIRMKATTANNLSSPNGTLTADGSRIELSPT